jgi:aspartate/methionine/tyrosine aminotransferase
MAKRSHETMKNGGSAGHKKEERDSMLSDNCPPMGIYETLYAFRDTWGAFMGTKGTHPWAQGFPLTTRLEKFDGPELPTSVEVTWEDRFYPKAWGHPLLRETIANYYNDYYKCKIVPENIMVFAGGRPGIHTILAFLKDHVEVRISNTEWPAYLDIMTAANAKWSVVPCTKENGFHPKNSEYFDRTTLNAKTHLLPIISNPGNPTGHTRHGKELEELIAMAEQEKNGILLDEAYEMFHSPSVSGIEFVKDLDNSNVFITGACTKGLQCPGIRIGWVVASKKNIETMQNFSSFGMGGVSHPSQLYAVKLFEPARVKKARHAIEHHYKWQRERYGEAFKKMGLTLYTGSGGFYHWMELPEGLNSDDFNKRLFKRGAAILKGVDCDMARPHTKDPNYVSPYERMFRFSFGPLAPEDFENDIKIMSEVLAEYKTDAGVK